jgi:hypothetical protein
MAGRRKTLSIFKRHATDILSKKVTFEQKSACMREKPGTVRRWSRKVR